MDGGVKACVAERDVSIVVYEWSEGRVVKDGCVFAIRDCRRQFGGARPIEFSNGGCWHALNA